MITAKDVLDSFSDKLTHLKGPLEAQISQPDHPATQKSNTIVYLQSPESIDQASGSTATCWVVAQKLAEHPLLKEAPASTCVFLTTDPTLAMALINRKFFSYKRHFQPFEESAIHPSAVVHPTATVASSAIIGPNTTIGPGAVIEEGCSIGPNCTLEEGVKVGSNTALHAQVFVGRFCELGKNCEVHPQTSIGTDGYGYAHDSAWNHYRIDHFGKAILEDDVHVGAGVNIDRGTYKDSIIRKGTKIDNHCHLAHNHDIGKNSLITAGFIVAGSTKIGDNFVCGGRTSVQGHIEVTNNVQLAALSVATKPIDQPGAYAGYPLAPHKDHLRSQAIIGKLPELKKTVAALAKKVGL